MRKQADRKVPQKRMYLRSLRKKTEHGMGAFGSACVRTALVLSLAAGALALPSRCVSGDGGNCCRMFLKAFLAMWRISLIHWKQQFRLMHL